MTEVFLHVYDVANSDSVKANHAIIHLNKFFKDGIHFGGIFHSAVEVYGQREWSFGYCESETGVFSCPPKQNTMFLYRESLSLGRTELSPSEVKKILIEMRKGWLGNSYDVLSRNCNHFCNDFCLRLGVQKLPAWVNRLANAGETAVGVAESTSKLLKQAYRVLFSGASTSSSTVSPEPVLLESSDPKKNEGKASKLPLLKIPGSLCPVATVSVGSSKQILN